MYVRRAYWLLCITNALISCCRILGKAKRHSRAANSTERAGYSTELLYYHFPSPDRFMVSVSAVTPCGL